jgi:hypothetical protein
MSRKLSIIGRGTAGCLSALHFSNRGYDVDWYYDPNTPALSVGEGTDLILPRYLGIEMGMNHEDFIKLDGHYKHGVEKINWGKTPFTHQFGPDTIGWHVNANKLQNYIIDYVKDKVNIIEKKIEHKDIDNYIIDCSGKPLNSTELEPTPIPVNKSYIVQCPWDKPRFNKTLAIAKSYGWVFLIPLQNRCSVGYLYNSKYVNFDHLKQELNDILKEYDLTPTSNNTVDFNNYYRSENFNEKVSYNGNASFFLEPMEATSLSTSILLLRWISELFYSYGKGYGEKCENKYQIANNKYKIYLEETIDIIMLHYLIEPPIQNEFWNYANHSANEWFNNRFKNYPKIRLSIDTNPDPILEYSTWFKGNFIQNIKGLNIQEKLNNFKW